ncbi:MAG: hypothetical protein HQL44_12185 [Alphaproteobacteria bacterium]|nr:hypothetical protein [Alphaproteobacteria bacterium]
MFTWFLERLKEPSSWAGLSALALALGVSELEWAAIGNAGAAVAAAVAVVLKERARG